jgi:hypothetical protein
VFELPLLSIRGGLREITFKAGFEIPVLHNETATGNLSQARRICKQTLQVLWYYFHLALFDLRKYRLQVARIAKILRELSFRICEAAESIRRRRTTC